MEDFIVYLAKSSICLGIFLLVYCLFLRRTTFFRFNRFYLLTGLLAAFILPLFHYTYEVKVSLPIPFFEVETVETSEPVETVVTGQSSGIETGTLLLVVYALGLVVRLLLHLNAYRKFRRLLHEGEQERLNNYCIVDNPAVKSPFSVFNCIFINSSNLSGVEKDSILKHEQTHITQRHWIDLLCSQFAIMLQWFNPLMWLYIRCQKENHEFLADKAVLEQGVSPALYQAVLINQKFQARVFAFGHPFNYSKPLNRLKMMKKAKTKPWQKAIILILIPAFGAFFHAFAEPRYVVEFSDDYTDSEKVSAATTAPPEQTNDDANLLIAGSDNVERCADIGERKGSSVQPTKKYSSRQYFFDTSIERFDGYPHVWRKRQKGRHQDMVEIGQGSIKPS
jgi:hypothetical protein